MASKYKTKTVDRRRSEEVMELVESLGCSLADHGHKWLPRERWLYQRSLVWLRRFIKAQETATD